MIVTNNPDVAKTFTDAKLLQGTPLDVLRHVADLLEQGMHLVTSPLSANNRLNRSPYRSIVLSTKASWQGDDKALNDRALEHLALQGFVKDSTADADYRWIDLEHLKTALEEAEKYHAL